MNLPSSLVLTVATLTFALSLGSLEAAMPKPGEAEAAADAGNEQLSNLEALMDSAVELKDDTATLEAAAQILAIRPTHFDALENSIDISVKRKDAVAARGFAERMVKAWPDKPQSHLLFADACGVRLPGESSDQAYALIAEHLAIAKKLQSGTKDFDRQEELAEAYDKSHQHHEAREAYLEVAALSSTSFVNQKEALTRAEEIADRYEPRLSVSLATLLEKEGTLVGLDNDVYAGMCAGWLVGLHGHEDWVDSKRSPRRRGFDSFGQDDRQQALVTARHMFGDAWQVDAQAGVDLNRGTSAAGGVTVTKTTDSDFIYKATVQGNELTSESLLLVRAGGRQQRAAVEAELPLGKQFDVQFGGQIRRIDTDVGYLGWGAGSNVEAEWRPFTQHQWFTLGYEWDYSRFHFQSNFDGSLHPPLRDFVLRETDSHLAVVDLKHTFGALTSDLRLAGGYAFAQHRSQWDPALTLTYRLTSLCRVSLAYEYDSADGKRATSGDSHSLTLGLNVVF